MFDLLGNLCAFFDTKASSLSLQLQLLEVSAFSPPPQLSFLHTHHTYFHNRPTVLANRHTHKHTVRANTYTYSVGRHTHSADRRTQCGQVHTNTVRKERETHTHYSHMGIQRTASSCLFCIFDPPPPPHTHTHTSVCILSRNKPTKQQQTNKQTLVNSRRITVTQKGWPKCQGLYLFLKSTTLQTVVIKGEKFRLKRVVSGIPQGSVLGPYYFLSILTLLLTIFNPSLNYSQMIQVCLWHLKPRMLEQI